MSSFTKTVALVSVLVCGFSASTSVCAVDNKTNKNILSTKVDAGCVLVGTSFSYGTLGVLDFARADFYNCPATSTSPLTTYISAWVYTVDGRSEGSTVYFDNQQTSTTISPSIGCREEAPPAFEDTGVVCAFYFSLTNKASRSPIAHHMNIYNNVTMNAGFSVVH